MKLGQLNAKLKYYKLRNVYQKQKIRYLEQALKSNLQYVKLYEINLAIKVLFMDKIRTAWASLPSTLKVILYSGISQLLGLMLTYVNAGRNFDWRELLAVALGTAINTVAYLILREKENGSQG